MGISVGFRKEFLDDRSINEYYSRFERDADNQCLGKLVDKNHWTMVSNSLFPNSYYYPQFNSIGKLSLYTYIHIYYSKMKMIEISIRRQLSSEDDERMVNPLKHICRCNCL